MEARRIFARLGSLLVLCLAASRPVHAADNTIAVLGIEATDGAPDSVASLVTDALRQRATGERGMRLVPGKDLVDIKLIFSCPDEAPTCMADAAKNLGVSRMIFGSVKRAPGDSYVMTLKMLDVSRRQVVAWVGEPLSRTLATPGAIRGPVEKWFATLTGQSTSGTVRIRGDMAGISVALDGAPMGITNGQDMLLNNVPAGRREIVASKPGYAPVRKEVSVVAGGSVDVTLDLGTGGAAGGVTPPGIVPIGSPYAPIRDEPGLATSARPSAGRDALKWGSWATAAASVASFGLAIKFALDVSYYNGELDRYRRFDCPGAMKGTASCGVDGKPARPVTEEENKFVDGLTEDGNRFQTYEFIALGVGGAFAIASGVMFYFGYFADDADSSRLGKLDAKPHPLRILPYATGDGGGISALYRF